jgi:MYXO-CTERM domain-containing protein
MARPSVIACFASLIAVSAAIAPRAALANGAFPESFQLLLPADRPRQIALATNFGLLVSDDDGATWTWTCEQPETANGSLYAVGPAPMDRYFSVSPLVGLAHSDDASCSWTLAKGTLEGLLTTDFFPDPSNAMRVYAIAQDPDGATTPKVYPSDDAGATFGAPIYDGTTADVLMGVESARSDPKTIYVAAFTVPGIHPKLLRTRDGGATWTTLDLEPQLGANNFRLIAVDPADANTVTLRVIQQDGEAVAISHDGGDTFAKPIFLAGGVLTSYAKLESGTQLVAGFVLDKARGFRSTDGGKTFGDWQIPHLRAMGVRDGKLYGAAKNYSDDWAVGVSTDEGLTFTPLTRYDQVKAIRACVQTTCQDACQMLVSRQVWTKSVCDGSAPPPPPASGGCGCGVAGATGGAVSALAVATLVGLAAAARRRRQRR